MTTTIEIKREGTKAVRVGTREVYAIRALGSRLADESFRFYLDTIRGCARQTPAGTAFTGGPRFAWITDADAIGAIVAAFQKRGWTVALDDAARSVCAGSVAIAQEKNEQIERDAEARSEAAKIAIERADAALAKRGHSLFGFQREGIAALCSLPAGRAMLLADEMGLGKTLQTISAIGVRAVIVCPSVAKGVWAREIAAYRPDLTPVLLSGRGSFRWPAEGEVVIINYDILPAAPSGKDQKGLDLLYTQTSVGEAPEGCDLVADEAHALKNNKAKRTLAFRCLRCSVARNGGRTYLLTATPMLNRPPELWSVLTSAGLQRGAFGDYATFSRLFGARETRWGVEWDGPSAEGSREIGSRLERVMLRRLRANVVDLPRKTWQTIPVELSAATAKVCDKFLAELEKNGKTVTDLLDGKIAASFERLSMIRATLASAKIEALIEEVESYEEAGEPVVVFSAHRAPIDLFASREGWRVITGDTSPEERSEIQDAFQAGRLRGVACTIKAGGVAITLTKACHALFCDLEWTPALNAQAEDRVLRIGQQRSVVIKRLVCKHPLDERIAELLSEKQAMINASIEQTGGKIEQASTPLVTIPLVDLDAAISTLEAEKIEQAQKQIEKRATKARKHAAKRESYSDESEARSARSAREEWAAYALGTLLGSCDGVKEKDGMGFSASTRSAGAWLAVELESTGGMLTDRGWALAVAVASHHQRQVGRMPQE